MAQNYGIYSDIPALSDGAARLVAINQNPFLAEMMKRQDERAWEQYQAIQAARAIPAFPSAPTGGSPQIGYQNDMVSTFSQMAKSSVPSVQKQGIEGLAMIQKDLSGNMALTSEQKNAYSAQPNNQRGFTALLNRMVDPGYELNTAHNNKISELGYEYGQKRGFENLQLGNKGKMWNLENHGFLAEAPKRFEDVTPTIEDKKADKPPSGYSWADDKKTLIPIPGGPADKLGEKQKNQVVGIKNLNSAANEYINALDNWSNTDILSPDKTASMGLLYNNMMLQAKEAYNLGVLNGPDYQILTSMVRDPVSFSGALTSNDALKGQASKLKEVMGKYMGLTSDVPYSNATDFKGKTTGGASGSWDPPSDPMDEREKAFQEYLRQNGQ